MLQLAFACVLAIALCGQGSKAQTSVLVRIQPSEATVHVRESTQFSATVVGAYAGVRWTVEEKNGGTVDSNGYYTAPRRIGMFHVIAASEVDPRARTSATITVVVEADTDSPQ